MILRAVERAAEIGDREQEAGRRGNLGMVHWSRGEYEESLAENRRALAMAREVGAWSVEANALGGIGNALWALGRLAEGRDAHAEWLALAIEHGDRVGEAMAEGNLGVALRYMGLREEGRPHIERGVLLAEEGRREEGRADLEAALARARETDQPGVEIPTLAHLALRHGGELAGALDAATELLAEHETQLNATDAMTARFLLWKATSDPAHLAEAKRLLDHLVEHAPEAHRVSMVENVSFHRDIVTAWKEQGGQAG